MTIPIVDIFAGPGGLGEGFSSIFDDENYRFKTALSIEKDPQAHQTLELRSFFRQFRNNGIEVPIDYYNHLKGSLSRDELFDRYSDEAQKAINEAQCIELGGDGSKNSPENVDKLIRSAIGDKKVWGLLGGPPCQAYSVIGRSRMGTENASNDARTELYLHYLRILAVHQPNFFIFENVRGISSSKKNGENIFTKISEDLMNPCRVFSQKGKKGELKYSLHALSSEGQLSLLADYNEAKNFLIRSENYQVPQRRHRVIILGIKEGASSLQPSELSKSKEVSVEEALFGLPRLRSGISSGLNTDDDWRSFIFDIVRTLRKNGLSLPKSLINLDSESAVKIPKSGRGAEYVASKRVSCKHPNSKWFIDSNIDGVVNHSTRAHLAEDLYRYMFCAAFALQEDFSPKLKDFPKSLMPKHKSAGTGNFDDRFRVQLANKPSTTITSHISKDGHYFIHPDPTQCRSLTVREAARLQTFPDNYFFCGPRTNQYVQVGNAVPPILAHQIADVVYQWLKESNLT
jgi:DNA (cytosine-5)-methyltransferase 1